MRTSRICLRSVRRSDSNILLDWINDRDLRILNASFLPVSEHEHEQWFERLLLESSKNVFFVIERADTGKAIGSCQLLKIDWLNRSAELQIRIGDASSRGVGLGREAVQLLCDHAYHDLNLRRIHLHVFASNVRAIRTYESCGFVYEGTLRQAAFVDDEYVDVVLMARVRELDSR